MEHIRFPEDHYYEMILCRETLCWCTCSKLADKVTETALKLHLVLGMGRKAYLPRLQWTHKANTQVCPPQTSRHLCSCADWQCDFPRCLLQSFSMYLDIPDWCTLIMNCLKLLLFQKHQTNTFLKWFSQCIFTKKLKFWHKATQFNENLQQSESPGPQCSCSCSRISLSPLIFSISITFSATPTSAAFFNSRSSSSHNIFCLLITFPPDNTTLTS